jgi:hypothetical protein
MSSTSRRILPWLIAGALAVLSALLSWTPASAATPPAHTRQLTVDFYHSHVTLTVPAGWHKSHTRPTPSCGCGGAYRPVCIVASGDYGLDPDNCVLMVGGNAQEQTPDYPLPSWRLPKCKHWTTTDEADSSLGTVAADYRAFRNNCSGARSEQWTSVTEPSITLWHPIRADASDLAAAHAVGSARIGGRHLTYGRNADTGRVRNVWAHDGHAFISVDRVVVSLDGTLINHNPTTYDYRVSAPRHDTTPAACRHYLEGCTAGQLVAQFHKGVHPSDGTHALDGRVVSLYRYEQGAFSLAPFAVYAFTSDGDSGSCGC